MLLVAGGTYDYSTVLDTTEVLLSLTASQWTFKAPLPNKLTELKGVTINNKILMTGNNIDVLLLYRIAYGRKTVGARVYRVIFGSCKIVDPSETHISNSRKET